MKMSVHFFCPSKNVRAAFAWLRPGLDGHFHRAFTALQALLKSCEDTIRILAVLARGMPGKVALSNTSKALKMSDLVVVSACFSREVKMSVRKFFTFVLGHFLR